MRRLIGGIVVTVAAASCGGDSLGTTAGSTGPLLLQITQSPTPFTEVTAGPVRALIPDEWRPILVGAEGGVQEGLIAAPHPKDWGRAGTVEGMAAVWVDVARVGVPSDYYYLAATGSALDRLTHSDDCRPTHSRVIVDHRPTYFAGPVGSPGDYVARGQGTCIVDGVPTRWAYFIAAPGYGPVREIGIPNSGLYVVVAVIPDSHHAPRMLDKLLGGAEFGGAGVADFIAAARR